MPLLCSPTDDARVLACREATGGGDGGPANCDGGGNGGSDDLGGLRQEVEGDSLEDCGGGVGADGSGDVADDAGLFAAGVDLAVVDDNLVGILEGDPITAVLKDDSFLGAEDECDLKVQEEDNLLVEMALPAGGDLAAEDCFVAVAVGGCLGRNRVGEVATAPTEADTHATGSFPFFVLLFCCCCCSGCDCLLIPLPLSRMTPSDIPAVTTPTPGATFEAAGADGSGEDNEVLFLVTTFPPLRAAAPSTPVTTLFVFAALSPSPLLVGMRAPS